VPEVSVSVELGAEAEEETDPLGLEQAIWSERLAAARDLYGRASRFWTRQP
jgi:hypothetical protein